MKNLTPVKSIRVKCLDCCAGQASEVRNCEINECSLFPFRMGKNPNRKGMGRKLELVSQKLPI